MEAKISASISAILLLIFILIIVFLIFYRNVVYEKLISMSDNDTVIPVIPQINGFANKEDPYIKPLVLPNILTEQECNDIMFYASDNLTDPSTGNSKYVDPKNNQQYWIPKNNALVKPLIEKIAKSYDLPFENAENVQVIRYLPYQKYTDHYDSCCDNNDRCKDFITHGGQRVLSVIIYLNKEFENGETYFKNSDVKLKPNIGGAIICFPLAQNTNKCHPDSNHQALPVTGGIKWIANVWFRENKFT